MFNGTLLPTVQQNKAQKVNKMQSLHKVNVLC